jgi:(R,R)-butanediol dehydrogenase/meso-butanediol dehydrogenase/diacetyl reductase
MKAAVLKAAGSPLVLEEVPDSTPEASELVLKVGACGICGTDLHMSENTDPDVGWRVLPPGCVMGHEFAGEVVELGSQARSRWSKGDRVTALPWIGCGECADCRAGRGFRCAQAKMRASLELPGAYAEYCRVGARETIRLPDSVSFQEGALVEPLAVGLNAVRRAQLRPGDRVLIVGAGPVGLSVALWCRFFGAQHIVVSDLLAARAERSLDLGATAALETGAGKVREQAAEAAGGPPRVVFDCVGLPGSLQLAIDYAPHDARIVVVGLCMAGDQLFPTKALVKELEISFAFIYRQEDFETVVQLLGQGRIDAAPMISEHVDLPAFSQAFEALKQPNRQIKVMLEPN